MPLGGNITPREATLTVTFCPMVGVAGLSENSEMIRSGKAATGGASVVFTWIWT